MIDSLMNRVRLSVKATLRAKKADGEYLMAKKRCWISIYRVLVDYNMIIKEGDFAGFENLIHSFFINKPPRLIIRGKDLKQLSRQNAMFNLPISRWRVTPCSYTMTVKMKYCDVAEYFEKHLLRTEKRYGTKSKAV